MNNTQRLWNNTSQRYEVHSLDNNGFPNMGNCFDGINYMGKTGYGIKEALDHIDGLVKNSKDGDYPLKASELCIVQINTETTIVAIGGNK